MLKKVFFAGLIVIVVGSWFILNYDHHYFPLVENEGDVTVASSPADSDDVKKNEFSALATGYIDGIPEGVVLLDDKDAGVQKELKLWASRISEFAEARQTSGLDPHTVREMSIQVISLFRLLKEATSRERSGEEAYTPMESFNTMTLIMKMEKSFSDALGFTFSEFLSSQNTEEIKALVQS